MFSVLALGDSYTIGEGVDPSESWPHQLRSVLESKDMILSDLRVLARTGWTTEELEEAIQKADLEHAFDLVTLQIGVNDQYRGYPIQRFQKGYQQLMERAIGFAHNRPEAVVAVSIPDWGVTPFAADREVTKIAKEIDSFNATARSLALDHGLGWIDVTRASREAGGHSNMLTSDGLHPSALQYGRWVEIIWPIVRNLLRLKGA